MKRRGFQILKIIVSCTLLFYFIWAVDFRSTIHSLMSLRITTVLAILAIFFVGIAINSIKLGLLIPGIRFARIYKINIISIYYTMALPGQLFGEGARVFHLVDSKNKLASVASALVLDKITGLIGLVMTTCVGIAISQRAQPSSVLGILGALLLVAVAGAWLVRSRLVYGIIRSALDWGEQRIPRLSPATTLLGSSLDQWRNLLSNPSLLIGTVGLGALYQIITIASIAILGAGVGIQIGVAEWAWIFGVQSIVLLLPITIAGLGVREATFIQFLALYQVPSEAALALSVSIFSFQVFEAAIGAGLLFWDASSKNDNSE